MSWSLFELPPVCESVALCSSIKVSSFALPVIRLIAAASVISQGFTSSVKGAAEGLVEEEESDEDSTAQVIRPIARPNHWVWFRSLDGRWIMFTVIKRSLQWSWTLLSCLALPETSRRAGIKGRGGVFFFFVFFRRHNYVCFNDGGRWRGRGDCEAKQVSK